MTEENFFVGYKAIPATLKRFYRVFVVLGLCIASIAGFSLASNHTPYGDGLWETAEQVTIQGFLTADPYPLIHRRNPNSPEQLESIMLVMLGKHSASEPSIEHANSHVAASGYLVQRGGWLMLEIESSEAIKSTDAASGAISTATTEAAEDLENQLTASERSLGKVTLEGEIMDSKCFLGVMKPGSGPIHKACAELCMLGGIPPMLVVRVENEHKFGYLLTRSDGSSASTLLSTLAAEPVAISGELVQKGDILSIRIAGDEVSRL